MLLSHIPNIYYCHAINMFFFIFLCGLKCITLKLFKPLVYYDNWKMSDHHLSDAGYFDGY
jgi:hypothetical protein